MVEQSLYQRVSAPDPGGSGRHRPSRLGEALDLAAGIGGERRSGGVPGLRQELFPAAAWRREIDRLQVGDAERSARQTALEEARVAQSLAHLRAEELMRDARAQARRLMRTASAVARARQGQAERAAAETIAEAERRAEAIIASAVDRAREIETGPPLDAVGLHSKLLRLQGALEDAETRLAVYSRATRDDLDDVIDLDAIDGDERLAPSPMDAQSADERSMEEQEPDEDFGLIVDGDGGGEPEPQLVTVAPVIVPKSRFRVPGLTPDRIEALRDEMSP